MRYSASSKPSDEAAYAEKVAIKAAIVAKKPDNLSHVESAALALIGLTALVLHRGHAAAEVRRNDTDPGRRGRRRELRDTGRQAHRRARHHDGEHGEPRLRAQPRRRPGHRLQHTGFHEGGVRLRRGVRHRRRRRDAALVRRAASRAGAPRSSARAQHGAGLAAFRRHIAASEGRSRPARTSSASSSLVASGAVEMPEIKVYPLSDAAAAHRVSEGRHLRGKLVFKVR